MSFELRDTTQYIASALKNHYQINPKFALLYVKTGGGKTYAAIHTFGSMFKDATLLVFTANNVKHSKQWENSVRDYNKVMGTHLVSIVHNYEKLALPNFFPKLAKQLTITKKPVILILDEIHKIKLSGNGKASRRMKNLIKLTRNKIITTTLGLSATPFSNSFIDVAPYLVLAGFYNSKTAFLNEHIKFYDQYHSPLTGPAAGIVDIHYFNKPQIIIDRFASLCVSVDTSKYYPKVNRYHLTSTLTKDVKQQYRQIKRDYLNHKNYEFPIQARMAQQRLISQSAYQKDLQLIKILRQREKGAFKRAPVLIFYQYTSSLTNLLEVLTNVYPLYKIKIINGNHKFTLKSAPKDPDTIVLVQYQAGGEGLDWQWSNCSIFYEAPIQYEKLIQARGRNIRDKIIMPRVYQFELETTSSIDGERWNIMQNHGEFTDDFAAKTL